MEKRFRTKKIGDPYERKEGIREQSRRVLVVVEGEVTEFEYFKKIRTSLRLPEENLKITHANCTTPIEIVKAAIQRKNTGAAEVYDEVWCVFDVEAKVDQQCRHGMENAVQNAIENGIGVAISNPCFELWIYLHKVDHQSPVTSERVQSLCKKEKLVDEKRLLNLDQLMQFRAVACKRAEQLEAKHRREGKKQVIDQNPSSGVYKLIHKIKEAFPGN